MSEPIRVILVEDDSLLRESLASYLALVGYAVTAVGDGISYYQQLCEDGFVVAVIDLGLPDQAGEILVEYTRRNTSSAIIVITARDTLETRVDCYRTGADLFLGKPVHGPELAAAIASLAGRHARLAGTAPTPRVASDAWRLLARQRALVLPDGHTLDLTPREYRLLDLLAAGDGILVGRASLLGALYGRQDESASRALETLVRRTRKKLAEHYSGSNLILTQHGLGYALAAPLMRE
jgi:DNA-binding response OmpR family regulator